MKSVYFFKYSNLRRIILLFFENKRTILRRDIRLSPIFKIIISFIRRFNEQSFSRLQSKERYRGNRYLRYAVYYLWYAIYNPRHIAVQYTFLDFAFVHLALFNKQIYFGEKIAQKDKPRSLELKCEENVIFFLLKRIIHQLLDSV